MTRRTLIQSGLESARDQIPEVDTDALFGQSIELADDIGLEAQRLRQYYDIADGLEDLVVATESIEDVSPANLLLIEAGVNLAFAGTDIRAIDIIPSLESQTGGRVSMEGVTALVRQVMEAIRRFMKAMWARIVDFFIAVFSDVGMVRVRATLIKAKVAEIDGLMPRTPSVSLGSAAYGVSTEIGPPPDSRALVRSLTDMLHQTRVIRETYVPVVLRAGEDISKTIRTWGPTQEDGEGWLQELNHHAGKYNIAAFIAAIGRVSELKDARFPAGASFVAPPLPGGRSLVFIDGERVYADKVDSGPMNRAMILQTHSVSLNRISPNKSIDVANAKMATMPPPALHEVLGLVMSILDEIDAGIRSDLRHKLISSGRHMDATLANMDVRKETALPQLRRGLRYCGVYTQWAYSPYVQLLAHALSVCRSTLTVCNRHIAAHRGS